MPKELRIPQVSDKALECTVVNWLKNEREQIEPGDPIVVVEIEKASLEVTSDVAGVLAKILVPSGSVVGMDQALAIIALPGENVSGVIASEADKTPRGLMPSGNRPSDSGPPGERRLASPAARRIAKELGVDMARLAGSGPGGLITEKDVRTAAERMDVRHEEERWIPYTGLRRTIGERMALSRRSAADVTTVTEVDMTEVAVLRRQFAMSYTACVSKATVDVLGRYPILNSSLQGDKILLKKDINLGIAVAITDGLLVPVIKMASRFSVQELDAEIDRLSTKARNGQLTIEEMKGGTFTLTNSGAFGTLFFTPVINYPEVAILGMGKVRENAVVRNQQVVVGLMMYLCLSYDHRVVDGAIAAEFLQAIKQLLENPRSLLSPK